MGSLEITKLFKENYKGKSVLITGNTGFKGSWLAFWLTQLGAKVTGYSSEEFAHPFHYNLLTPKTPTIYGNILNKELLLKSVQKIQPDIIFHLAAQSLVRASYITPSLTYETNVIGTLHVLEAASACESVKAFINVTSDKVYENFEWERGYHEKDILGGYDMYSSSKACSEILTSSFKRSFLKDKIAIASVRAGNVIGGGDMAADRLIPDVIRAASNNTSTNIRNIKSIRPWQHVLEPLSGYLLVGQKLIEGRVDLATAWNFGPDDDQCLEVGTILDMMRSAWPRISYISKSVETTMHEAGILKLDCSKAKKELKWLPVWNNQKTIEKTVNWYREYYEEGAINTASDLNTFIADAKAKKLCWTIE
ncbi:MAG TPA: CDP-glucose 4,6-dehydratase [Cytophagaceae bacterium]|jgi:CDP-glucose 4,6-dehydratase|nr:CDP-glucose 4,6-dehydratase [Cytophagaceae bacterium]